MASKLSLSWRGDWLVEDLPVYDPQDEHHDFEKSTGAVARVRRLYVTEGFERALYRKKPDRDYKRTLDGEGEAHLVALCCSEAPDGYARWSLRLLADRMVELGLVEELSYGTVRRVLKKTNSNLIEENTGSSHRAAPTPTSQRKWSIFWTSISRRPTPSAL